MKTDKELMERIIALMPIASTDETRDRLCGVLIEPCEGGVYLKACDGHRLIVEKIMLEGSDRFSQKLMVKKHQVPVIKSVIKTYKYGFDIEVLGNELKLGTEVKMVLETVTSYPNTDQLIPTFTPVMEIGLNAKLLFDLAKSLKEGRHDTVKLSIKDGLSPILVSVSGRPESQAVLMPARV